MLTSDLLCNGVTDCDDASDEQPHNCRDILLDGWDGAPCDNGTKWIRMRYLCTGNRQQTQLENRDCPMDCSMNLFFLELSKCSTGD